jgi:hypothetical protein
VSVWNTQKHIMLSAVQIRLESKQNVAMQPSAVTQICSLWMVLMVLTGLKSVVKLWAALRGGPQTGLGNGGKGKAERGLRDVSLTFVCTVTVRLLTAGPRILIQVVSGLNLSLQPHIWTAQ